MKVFFEEVKCPKCLKLSTSDIIEAGKLEWDHNYNCYHSKLWCHCENCGADFTINELWDHVGFDPDSINVV